MRKRIEEQIDHSKNPNSPEICNSFDVVGNIAIIRSVIPNFDSDLKSAAKKILDLNNGIKTVLVQNSKVSGEYRLRNLIHAEGENKTRTLHKEHGCVLSVDLEKCYFSPRLSGERLRIARLVRPHETVVNMFAGVGCFSILIVKTVPTAKVYSIDINPDAIKYMKENIRLNRLYGKVVPLLGDSKSIIENELPRSADRVLMPLPEKAFQYLPIALTALKTSGGWVHCYCFEHACKADDPRQKARAELKKRLHNLGLNFDVPYARVVRPVGPNWYQIVLDLHVEC